MARNNSTASSPLNSDNKNHTYQASFFPTDSNNGPYVWYYEMKLLKNMTVFMTVFKVILGVGLFINIALQLVFLIADGHFDTGFFTASCLIFLPLLLAITFIGFLLYSAIMKGTYCVVFEMDGGGIRHTQLARQFKKAQVIGAIAAVLGATTGNLSLAGSGILAGSRNSVYTNFDKLNSVKVDKKRETIYLRSNSFFNQIYVPQEHFDDVVNYIIRNSKVKAIA